jgi:hypothetical protein
MKVFFNYLPEIFIFVWWFSFALSSPNKIYFDSFGGVAAIYLLLWTYIISLIMRIASEFLKGWVLREIGFVLLIMAFAGSVVVARMEFGKKSQANKFNPWQAGHRC